MQHCMRGCVSRQGCRALCGVVPGSLACDVILLFVWGTCMFFNLLQIQKSYAQTAPVPGQLCVCTVHKPCGFFHCIMVRLILRFRMAALLHMYDMLAVKSHS